MQGQTFAHATQAIAGHEPGRVQALAVIARAQQQLPVTPGHLQIHRARAAGVEMPIAECVVALLDGRLQAADAVARLMEREPTVERR